MSSTPRTSPSTTGFPRPSKSAFALGLTLDQWLGIVGLAGIVALVVFTGLRPTVRGGLLGAGIVLATLTFTKVDGRSGLIWARLALSHEHRRRAGHTTIARPVLIGRVELPALDVGAQFDALPGPWAALKVFEHNGIAYVYDPGKATMSWIAQLRAPDYVLSGVGEQNARVAAWERVLAAACADRTGIAQVQVLERLTPSLDDAIGRYATTARDTAFVAAEPELAVAYDELIAGAGRGTPAHEVFLVVTVRKSAAFRRLRASNRAQAMIEATEQSAGKVARLLEPAGLRIVDRPDARRLSQIVRGAFDPWGTLAGPAAGPVPGTAGPTGGFEAIDHVACDGMYHATLGVFEWPTNPSTRADFLWDLVFPEGVALRTLSLFYRPYSQRETRKAIQGTHSAEQMSRSLRAKTGRVETLEDSRERRDMERREAELDEGHREVGIGALVSVSATSLDDLEEAVAILEAVGNGIDIRRLRMQQWQMFCAAALPLGRVIV